MVYLSVVIPAYDEEKNVYPLANRLVQVLSYMEVDYEIIFVDDGSTDRTFEMIAVLHEINPKIKAVSFRRNFGKAAALSAGFQQASGDYILTMDSDLQEDPEEIPLFFDKIDRGYDLVCGWKAKRRDSFLKVFPSLLFNMILRLLTGIKIHDSDCNYRLMRKEVSDNLDIYGGMYRYIPIIAQNRGFRVGEVKIRHRKRLFGKSKYNFTRLFTGVLDVLTIKFLTSYDKRPLHFFGGVGISLFSVGFLAGLYLAYVKYLQNQLIGHRPLLLFSILLILVGMQLLLIGLIGEMITNTNFKKDQSFTVRDKIL